MIGYFQSILESILVGTANETHSALPDGCGSHNKPFSGKRKH